MLQLMIKIETWLLLHDFYALQIICFAFDELVNLRLSLMTSFMIQIFKFCSSYSICQACYMYSILAMLYAT